MQQKYYRLVAPLPRKTASTYRAADLKYHPDKNPAGAEMMKLINAAFEVLKDFEGELLGSEAENFS